MLRRSPRLTPSLLAANRANALKSTGPRTARGKRKSSANAFRNGRRTSPRLWLRTLSRRELADVLAFRAALDRATLAGAENQKALARTVCRVWAVKRDLERQLRKLEPSERLRFLARITGPPRCVHQTIARPDWKVTISVVVRRGRCPGWSPSLRAAFAGGFGGRREGGVQAVERKLFRLQAHVILKITCTRHPWYDRGCEGVPLRTRPDRRRGSGAAWHSPLDGEIDVTPSGPGDQEFQTNPERSTQERSSENISPIANSLCPGGGSPPPVNCHPNLTSVQSSRNHPATQIEAREGALSDSTNERQEEVCDFQDSHCV